ncbi:hypothetical protein GCK32_004372, partial [Trichostrongylus colubriformis]
QSRHLLAHPSTHQGLCRPVILPIDISLYLRIP